MPPKPIKKRLASTVRIFIRHKQVIALHSDWYKRPDVAKSMRKVNDLLQMVKGNCDYFTSQRIAKMVLIHQDNLYNILPVQKNPSYQRQSEKLEEIINTAKTILNK